MVLRDAEMVREGVGADDIAPGLVCGDETSCTLGEHRIEDEWNDLGRLCDPSIQSSLCLGYPAYHHGGRQLLCKSLPLGIGIGIKLDAASIVWL